MTQFYVSDRGQYGTKALAENGIYERHNLLAEIRTWDVGIRQFLVDEQYDLGIIERVTASGMKRSLQLPFLDRAGKPHRKLTKKRGRQQWRNLIYSIFIGDAAIKATMIKTTKDPAPLIIKLDIKGHSHFISLDGRSPTFCLLTYKPSSKIR